MNKLVRFCFFATIITAYLFSAGEESYLITWGAYILFMGSGLLWVLSHGGKIIVYKEIWLFVLFVAYSGLSLLWAMYNRDQSLSFLFMMIAFTVLSCSIFKTKEDVEFLIKANIWSGVILSFYVPLTYGFSNYISDMIEGMRMGSEVGGANTVGICTSMSFTMALGYYLYKKDKWYIAAMIPMVFTCFSTASRMALITMIFGCMIIFFINDTVSNKKKIQTFIRNTLICAGILVVGYYILKLVPEFNRLYVRIDELAQVLLGNMDSTDGVGANRIRSELISVGMNAFKENPLLGIGYNNGRYLLSGFKGNSTYSLHNNFVTILCDGGIVGFIIYYALYGSVIIKILKKKNRNLITDIALGTIILNLIGHISGVFYPLKFYYPWLIIWVIAANLPDEAIETNTTPNESTSETGDVQDNANCDGLGWNPSR